MKRLLSVVRRFGPKRIWQQIFLILVALVVIPLAVLGVLLIYTSQKAIKTTVLRDHKEIAIHTTGEIGQNIKASRQALQVTAAILGRLQSSPWRQETAIVELSLKSSVFEKIVSVDVHGQEIAVSQPGEKLKDRSAEEAFRRALAGTSYVSSVKISGDHEPFLTLAEPIRQSGAVQGVLIADLNLRGIWRLVDAIKIGHQGKAYIVDRQGRIIAHPDKKRIFDDANIAHPIAIQDILSGRSGNFEDTDADGRKWLTSYAPIADLNWGLVIIQPVAEVLAFADRMKWQSAVLILISIFLTVLLSLFLSRLVTRPVNDILESTRRAVNGDFSHPLRIRSKNEIGRLLFSLNRMQDKLHRAQQTEKLSIVGRAAGVIAHELKNSLVLIQTFIELLPERHDDKKFIEEFKDTVPKELDAWNESLRSIMGMMRDADSAGSGDINEIVREIGLLTKLKARQKNIRFEMNIQDDLPPVPVSQEKLKQVLMNLINNALDASSGGGVITVEAGWISSCSGSGCVEMKVSDTGEGIKKENLERIFEPFFSTKSGGLGLGLSICKEIVNACGGQIKALSREDQGATFVVCWPIERLTAGGMEDCDSVKKSVS